MDGQNTTPVNVGESALAIWPAEIGRIEGRVLTVVESLGLNQTQEKAVKDLMRKAVWEEIYNRYRVFVSLADFNKLTSSQEKAEQCPNLPRIKKSK